MLVVMLTVVLSSTAFGQLDHEQEPINYSKEKATDPVARLIEIGRAHV